MHSLVPICGAESGWGRCWSASGGASGVRAAFQCGDGAEMDFFNGKKLFLDFFENTTGKISKLLNFPRSFIKIR
jgi:hypothetical protein